MALDYRRGSAAIQDAAERTAGSGFRPFIPNIAWRNDGDSKHILVLTDMDDVATLLLHSFIPIGKGEKANGEEYIRYDEFLSRRDTALGEDYDDLEDRLDREPKTRCMGVMIELDPILEAGTAKKLKGFRAKTETYTRQTDDGEIEIRTPVIGLCTQSAQLMWGPINNLYHQLGDLTVVPLSITRHGEKTNTRYDLIPFMEKPVDLTPVIEFMDGISYIGDGLETLVNSVEATEGDVAKAQVVADYLLSKRIDELADADRYAELVGPLEPEDMPKNPWGRKPAAKNSARSARPSRRSPREASEEIPAPEERPSKNDRFAALKSRVEAEARTHG